MALGVYWSHIAEPSRLARIRTEERLLICFLQLWRTTVNLSSSSLENDCRLVLLNTEKHRLWPQLIHLDIHIILTVVVVLISQLLASANLAFFTRLMLTTVIQYHGTGTRRESYFAMTVTIVYRFPTVRNTTLHLS